jgi:hypothetical protein
MEANSHTKYITSRVVVTPFSPGLLSTTYLNTHTDYHYTWEIPETLSPKYLTDWSTYVKMLLDKHLSSLGSDDMFFINNVNKNNEYYMLLLISFIMHDKRMTSAPVTTIYSKIFTSIRIKCIDGIINDRYKPSVTQRIHRRALDSGLMSYCRSSMCIESHTHDDGLCKDHSRKKLQVILEIKGVDVIFVDLVLITADYLF